jgi:ATPase involved in DNA repair
LNEIIEKEKTETGIAAESKQIRQSLNAAEEILGPKIEDDNIEPFLAAARENEKTARDKKHIFSEKAAVISADKSNIENEIIKAKKDKEAVRESKIVAEKQIEERTKQIADANASVENGYSKAKTEKEEFSALFDELIKEFNKRAEEVNLFSTESDKEVSDISFYSSLVKAEDLPLPSNEKMWEDLISDIERLEELVSKTTEEEQLTEEEKKKASIEGELEEKGKNIEDMEKEIHRLNEEIGKTELDLKNETAESDKKKKLLSDFEMLLVEHAKQRNGKIKLCPILKETVPISKYQLNDIAAEEINRAYDILIGKKEQQMTEAAALKSEDAEIEKAVLKKETLLKAGKCPTCGQEIKSDESHREHGTEDELKRRQEIKIRTEEIKKLLEETDVQSKMLKEIQGIDEKVEKNNSEINTLRAEEKGKSDLIEKYKKDLEEISLQKTERNARKMEHAVFCEARKKDLESIEKRLLNLREENAEKQNKIKRLAEKKKELTKSINSILRDYKTLENEKKLKQDAQNRLDEIEKTGSGIEETLKSLKEKMDKISAEKEKTDDEKRQAEAELEIKIGVTQKAERLAALENEKRNLKTFVAGSKKTMEQQDKIIDDLRNQIADKKIKIKQMTEKIAELDGGAENMPLEEQRKILTGKIDRLAEEIQKWEGKRDTVHQETGTFKREILMLSEYEKEAEILRNKIHYISLVSEDVSVLEEMYRRIRADMRSKNIEALDRLLNDMFEFIYSNNAYSHLELDADYNLKVHEKDGSVLEPKQLSGGERAIFNLALRCAIYRLLSLGFGENGTGKNSLPPLIFDEPTVFLDSGHVRQLIHLIEHMKEDGVGQIIVVSHDESLIDSADENFKIEKDTVTNASSAACD